MNTKNHHWKNSRLVLLLLCSTLPVGLIDAATVTPSAPAGTSSNWRQDWVGASVSDGTWLLPAAVAGDTAVINQDRTLQVDTAVVVSAGAVVVNNTIGSPTPNAFLEINPGGTLTTGAITLSQNTDPGILKIQGGSLTTDQPVNVRENGSFILSAGSFTNNGSGTRTVFVDTNASGGVVNITGGIFTAQGAAATDALYLLADEINISGCTVDMGGGQVIPADTTTLTVSGDDAFITLDRFNANSATRSATIRFVFDESGVSPINSGGFLNLSHASLVIDGSAYAGGPGTFDLFISPNVASVSANVTVTGLGIEGVDYALTQDTVNNLVQLQITNYQGARNAVEALGGLTTAPAVYADDGNGDNPVAATPTSITPGDLKRIYYEALDFEGNATRVHAWVGIPAGASAGSPVPAIVLVHGGGGTAFLEWVQKWNDRGYAAIAMGLEGQTDTKATQQQIDAGLATSSGGDWLKHAMPGPERLGIYADTEPPAFKPLEDQWMYHCVADVILANSLMRSLPFVDSSKVGVHGVSWGGVITSTVIGIDTRFSFAIPTYGCGHKWSSANLYGEALVDNAYYRQVWDPVLRMDQATLPVLWFSWPGDFHFPLDTQAYTYHAAINSTRSVSLVPGMNHGHAATWTRPESYDYADSVVNTGTPWCVQTSISESGSSVQVVFQSARTLNSATLIHTTGTGPTGDLTWPEVAVDSLVESPAGTWTINATLPAGTTGWFVNVKASATPGYVDANLIASSDYREVIDVTTSPGVEIDHPLPQAQSTGMLGLSFTAPTNVEIVGVQFSNESHPGAFSFGEPLPWVLWEPAPATSFLPVQFDNTVAGLTDLQSATATLTVVWEDQLDGTTAQLQVPVSVTARTPAIVTYSVTSNWSAQDVFSFDTVNINSGAAVTLDRDATAANLTVQDGSLLMTLGNSLILNDSLAVDASGSINLTSGSLSPNVETVQINGDLTINGGTFQRSIAGLDPDFNGSGTLALVSGAFSLTGGAATDLTSLGLLTEISGGSLSIDGQTLVSAAGVFKIMGNAASINLQRISGGSTGVFHFVLGPTGVSPVNVAFFANLQGASIEVDGSTYEGGPGTITLIDSSNLSGLVSPANISLTGFEGKGLTAVVVQDQTDGRDWVQLVLTLNEFGIWADGWGLSGADAFASADPDQDSLDNLMEYALGGNPLSGADAEVLPFIEPVAGGLEYAYPSRLDAEARGLTYTVQRSTGLQPGGWSTAGVTETGTAPIDSEFEWVINDIEPGDAVFVNLVVEWAE